MECRKMKNSFGKKRIREYIFVSLLIFYPVLNFFVFYVFVNLNTITLTFQHMDDLGNTTFAGWDNYVYFFRSLGDINSDMVNALFNSLICYAVNLIQWPFALMFAYWGFKKCIGSSAFRYIVMIPSMLAGVMVAMCFMRFLNVLPQLFEKSFGIAGFPKLLQNEGSRMMMTIYYEFWCGFGLSTIIYMNAMNAIDYEIIESAEIDGANVMQEFSRIILPMIFGTVSTYIVLGIAGILTSQGPLYLFWEFSAPRDTVRFGYLMYQMTMVNGFVDYPRVATMGLVCTLFVYPVVMLIKRFLEKKDPLGAV